VKVIPVL